MLDRAGVPSPDVDARILISDALGCTPAELGLRANSEVSEETASLVARRIAARARREPLQHILGRWPFLELDLRSDHRALIPRPESEDVVLAARDLLDSHAQTRMIDVGTGGGALALAFAASHPKCEILALDIDGEALALAQENRREHGLEERVQLVRSDLLTAVSAAEAFDLIIANLPYVSLEEYGVLEPEVRDFEPRQALVAARGGLEVIFRLLEQAPACLRPGGHLLLEMSPAQVDTVLQRANLPPWENARVIVDRFGRRRAVHSQRKP